MKYDPKHVPEYVGAIGKCKNCGLLVQLEETDIVEVLDVCIPKTWKAECPKCYGDVFCRHETKPEGIGK